MKQTHKEATQWFDELYKEHKDRHENIPWARLSVNPLLEDYLKKTEHHHGKALVIGCGLGDDAVALEVAGYEVTAIDISQTALDVAKERFSEAKVVWEKQDIFEMPEQYLGYFDFVFEALTIQSLPVEFREKMIKAIADTLAPKAHLLLVAHKKEVAFKGPPWPLEELELEWFKAFGLTELSCELHTEASKISGTKFCNLYTKE